MRRRVLKGLNKGESVNSVSRGIFFGRKGEILDRAYEDQMHRASCLHLLVDAIAAWNTIYLNQAIKALEASGEAVPEEYIPHIGNHGWDHVNLLGWYNFDPREGRPLSNLRPLRSETEIRETDDSES